MIDFKKKSWIYSGKNGSNHFTYFFLLWKRWQWEQQTECSEDSIIIFGPADWLLGFSSSCFFLGRIEIKKKTKQLCPIVYRYAQAGGKIYTYDFTHRSSLNLWPKWMGVTHNSEIAYVFGIPQNPSLGFTEEEVNLSRRMMKHWANFARTGSAWALTEAAQYPQDCSAQS